MLSINIILHLNTISKYRKVGEERGEQNTIMEAHKNEMYEKIMTTVEDGENRKQSTSTCPFLVVGNRG